MREAIFILPAWDLPTEYLTFGAALPQWNLPALDYLRRFARRRQVSFSGGDLLAQTFSGSLKTKIACDLDLPANTPCFLASPVSQHMDLHSMQLVSGEALHLSWVEAHALCNLLNGLLEENHWQCHVYRPDLWLVTYPQDLIWQASDIWSLGSRADSDSKITGQDAPLMLKILTEMQMLLFAHSQDFVRATSLPPVNGVWLWPDTMGYGVDTDTVIGQVSWLPERDHIVNSEKISWDIINSFNPQCERVIIYDKHAYRALEAIDLPAHAAVLQDFDRDVLQEACKAIVSGSLETIRIITERTILEMSAARRFCFWRRSQPYRGQI